uniref:Rho guanine nucleotide exchange factor 1 n=1 Tax=Pelusios castaneus TaxID=367368 RepID=A0A8C8S516_9SAUR
MGGWISWGAQAGGDSQAASPPHQNPDDQSSLFQSLELLKRHPAYLMAFLHHVVLQFDSSPVLCYLHVDLIWSLNAKEGRKHFLDFCHMFLDKAGLLRVPVPNQVQFELDRSRPELLSDETQRRFLTEIQNFQEPEISRQLEDFRSKRMMGMTPGERELTELESYRTRDCSIREAKEKQLAELLLGRLDEIQPTFSTDEEKSSAIVTAIVTYMKHLGVKTKLGDKKSKGNFFRKKISGSRKPEEAPKPKKGFSLLDATRWNRGESHSTLGGAGVPGSPEPLPDTQLPHPSKLFLTEHAHVRMLRVLLELFYQPLLGEGFFQEAEITNIFPGLDDLLEAHSLFLENLKKLREESDYIISEIGDVLLARFEGTEGSWFQKISARFCSRQSFALEQLKAKQRKETRFSQFIQEAESQARCRRLQLKDIIPIEMQRLTKYPLLLENIAKYTEETEEQSKVQRAAECCRQILNHVNQEVRYMENLMKLKDYQKRLDLSSLKQSTDPLLSEFKNTDITKRNLVHEGPLTWRVSKDKSVDVHVLLLDDILVLLQRQEERLVLRCHSRPAGPTPEPRQVLSPIIKLSSAMTREVATDHKAFYVIFSWENGAQIYELVAQTVSERKNWCALISDTAGCLKLPGSKRLKPRRAGHSLSAPHSPI